MYRRWYLTFENEKLTINKKILTKRVNGRGLFGEMTHKYISFRYKNKKDAFSFCHHSHLTGDTTYVHSQGKFW